MVGTTASNGTPAASLLLQKLIRDYSDSNIATVEELAEAPTALDFMQRVALNRPFVVRGGAQDWAPVVRWDAAYLARALADSHVNVAMTPDGYADTVLEKPDGSLSFVMPHEETRPFPQVLATIQTQERQKKPRGPIFNAQTQNDNLRNEFEILYERDMLSTALGPDWARIALGKDPDAVNLWIGNRHSVTSLHKDPYENVYVQVRGQKHFTLMPPVAAPVVAEVWMPQEVYRRTDGDSMRSPDGYTGSDKYANDGENITLVPQPVRNAQDDHARSNTTETTADEDMTAHLIPAPTWDPDERRVKGANHHSNNNQSKNNTTHSQFIEFITPSSSSSSLSSSSSPTTSPLLLRVTLDPGDMLYLPALWYHKVRQTAGPEDFCCAINYWYDMDFAGGFWATSTLVADLARSVNGQHAAASI